jgi:hypothetical protein
MPVERPGSTPLGTTATCYLALYAKGYLANPILVIGTVMAIGRNVKWLVAMLDFSIATVALIIMPFLVILARSNRYRPITRKVLDYFNIALLCHQYYSPVVHPSDIQRPLDEPRALPGLRLNTETQLALVQKFTYRDELLSIPLKKRDVETFGYHNGYFESGDAEMLYNFIRYFKPRRIVEIGCGQSTLLARLAQRRNREHDANYVCRHICIEPFEQPWLEKTGAEIIRKRIESADTEIIRSLEANDILFIDSSHVIRPQGDVVHEYLFLLGLLKPGVIIHAHDIFTPRDYPPRWILQDRKLWNEQYLLEAFLSFNNQFEILAAVNYLSHEHRGALGNACPILVGETGREPGSFWFRRRGEE